MKETRCQGKVVQDSRKSRRPSQQNTLKNKAMVPTGKKNKEQSNKDQRLHDELNHVDIEPLVYTLVQMKTKLRELEPPKTSMVPRITSLYKPQKYFEGFYL